MSPTPGEQPMSRDLNPINAESQEARQKMLDDIRKEWDRSGKEATEVKERKGLKASDPGIILK